MSFYWGNLPHWQPSGKTLFITWRLHPSCIDQHFLADPGVARVVVDGIQFGGSEALPNYRLHSYVVMSNHVHILIDPFIEVPVLLKSLKGVTARRANAVLGRSGLPFWQKESFDHWIRDEAEFRKAAEYIERNPVRAGLASRPEDYRWSSASGSDGSSSDVHVGDFDLEVEATAVGHSDLGVGATGLELLSTSPRPS